MRMVRFVAFCGMALVIASYGGALHPLGDSLAVFRVPLVVTTALAVIWTDWPRRLRWPLALLALGILGGHLRDRLPGETPAPDLVLYQQNLLWNRTEDLAFLAQVRAAQPDLMTLQEAFSRNQPLVEALKEDLPYAHQCPKSGEAVLSRFAAVPGSAFCSTPDGLAGMQVETPFGRVWLVSVHLNWPWPYRQMPQVDTLVPWLERLDGPVILSGDFNAVAWSRTVRRMARASGTALVGPDVHSFTGLPLPMFLGIDHVLTTPAAGVQQVIQMPEAGSDHHGLLALLKAPAHD